jgi:hypothetical protein
MAKSKFKYSGKTTILSPIYLDSSLVDQSYFALDRPVEVPDGSPFSSEYDAALFWAANRLFRGHIS